MNTVSLRWIVVGALAATIGCITNDLAPQVTDGSPAVADAVPDVVPDVAPDAVLDAVPDAWVADAVPDAESGKTFFGCEMGSSSDQTTHSCLDYVYTNMPDSIFQTAKGGCTQSGGTLRTICDKTGSIGGCRMTTSGAGITTELTIWHYIGDVTSETAICSSLGEEYSYVAP